MTREKNIAAQQEFGEAVNSGNFDVFDVLVAPDSIDHDPAPDQVPGPEGFKAFFTTLREAFPDLQLEVDKLVADEDTVAFAYTITGTQTGPFLGFPPSGKSVTARGVQISAFVDGKLAERWGSSDELGILTQLGYAPAP